MKKRNLGSANHLLQIPVVGLAIGVVGLLGYRQFVRMASPSRTVVVAQSALSSGKVVTAEDAKTVRRSSDSVPKDAFSSKADVEGKRLSRAKKGGEPFVTTDFAATVSTTTKPLSWQIPEGRVLTTLTIENLVVPFNNFRQGDSIDILVAGMTQERRRIAQVVVQDAYVVGYVMPKIPRSREVKGIMGLAKAMPDKEKANQKAALLLALKPEDVLPVARIDGSGNHVSLVLHAPPNGQDRLTVSAGPRPKTIDLIVGANRESVVVQ